MHNHNWQGFFNQLQGGGVIPPTPTPYQLPPHALTLDSDLGPYPIYNYLILSPSSITDDSGGFEIPRSPIWKHPTYFLKIQLIRLRTGGDHSNHIIIDKYFSIHSWHLCLG